MAINKGGRGITAPYLSTHIRVPDPLKAQIQSLKERYLDYVEKGGDPDHPPMMVGGNEQPLNVMALLTEIRDELLADEAITRGGKDRGSCRRIMDALVNRVSKYL